MARPTPIPLVPVDEQSGAPRHVALGSLAGVVAIGVAVVAVTVFVPRVQHAIGLTVTAACLALLTLPIQRWAQRFVGSVASMVATAIATLVVTLTARLPRSARSAQLGRVGGRADPSAHRRAPARLAA